MKKILCSAILLALMQSVFAQLADSSGYQNRQGGTIDQNGYPQNGSPTGTGKQTQPQQQPASMPNGVQTAPNGQYQNTPNAPSPNTLPQNPNGNVNPHTNVQPSVDEQIPNSNVWDYNNTGAKPVEAVSVPENLNRSFQEKYPNTTNAAWYQSQTGYTVRYQGNNKMEEQVMYDSKGHMIGTGRQMNAMDIPSSTMNYLEKNYKGKPYKTVYEISPSTGAKYYEVYVNDQWMKFDSKGNYIPIK